MNTEILLFGMIAGLMILSIGFLFLHGAGIHSGPAFPAVKYC